MLHNPTGTPYTASIYKSLRPTLWGVCLLTAVTLLTNACANIMAPQGGEKDTKSPEIVKTSPSHGGTRFQGTKLTIVFNKKIKFDPSQLSVTPKLEKKKGKPSYTYTVWGNTLTLRLKVPLAPDTTYTFNFDNAVKDLTEGNAPKKATLTFSTGEHLDQMSVAGYVIHHMTQHLIPQALVALYKADKEEDAQQHILNSPPDYFCYTDEKGKFLFKNIRKGRYYLYASKGEAQTLTVDPGKDMYGFLKAPTDLSSESLKDIILPILHADIRAFKLQSQRPQHQYFELSFSKPVKEYTLQLARQYKRFRGDTTLYSHLVDNKQVIRVYNTAGLLREDSLEATLVATDAMGNTIDQKVTIRFKEEGIKKHDATYDFSPSSGAAIKPKFVGTMRLNKPVKAVRADKISFVFGDKKAIPLHPQDLQFNAQRDVVTITKKLDPTLLPPPKDDKKPAELVLHIAEGAFVTVEGDQNEDLRYTYTFRNPKAYGTIKGTVRTHAPGFTVQLLDGQYKVVDEVHNTPQYQFHEVAPGNYRLRLLILPEKNSAWRFGNLDERREPDPVRMYPETVGVVANWVIEDINFDY